ncbi:MAG: HTTM domain-containing protein [Myxococcota bacterium]
MRVFPVILQRIDHWWRAPAPPERLAAVRILTGVFTLVYCAIRAPAFLKLISPKPELLEPVGPLSFLSAPLAPAAVVIAVIALLPLGLAFTSGWAFRWTGPAFAGLFLALTTYRSSFGMVFHTENLLCMHLIVLGLSPAADAWSLGPRASRVTSSRSSSRSSNDYGWPLKTLSAITVAVYFLAGLAKIENSGLAWVAGETLENHIAYDALRKQQVGSLYSPIGVALLGTPVIFAIMSVLSLLLELAAPVALVVSRLAPLWVAGAWSFHFGVLLLMYINFPYPLTGIAFLSFFRAERVVHAMVHVFRNRSKVAAGV